MNEAVLMLLLLLVFAAGGLAGAIIASTRIANALASSFSSSAAVARQAVEASRRVSESFLADAIELAREKDAYVAPERAQSSSSSPINATPRGELELAPRTGASSTARKSADFPASSSKTPCALCAALRRFLGLKAS